jgi:hypothetical protein
MQKFSADVVAARVFGFALVAICTASLYAGSIGAAGLFFARPAKAEQFYTDKATRDYERRYGYDPRLYRYGNRYYNDRYYERDDSRYFNHRAAGPSYYDETYRGAPRYADDPSYLGGTFESGRDCGERCYGPSAYERPLAYDRRDRIDSHREAYAYRYRAPCDTPVREGYVVTNSIAVWPECSKYSSCGRSRCRHGSYESYRPIVLNGRLAGYDWTGGVGNRVFGYSYGSYGGRGEFAETGRLGALYGFGARP